MTDLSAFVFIPLILTVVITVIIAFIVILAKIRTGKSSITLLLSLFILCGGTLFSILNLNKNSTFFIFSVTVSVSLLVLLAYVRYGFSSNEQKNEIKKEEEHVFEQESLEVKIPTLEDEIDESLLDVSRDFMIHAADAFSEEAGLSRLLDYINTNLIKSTAADGGAILLVDDFEDVVSVKSFSGDFPPPYKIPSEIPHKVVRIETNFRFSQFPLSETIFGAVATSGHPELVTNPTEDERFFQNEPEDFLKLGSYIIVPMKVRDTVIGVTALARKHDSKVFGEEEFKAAKVLTDFACTAIKNVYSFQEIVEHSELTREADMACKIQLKLHPKLLPAIPTVSLGHFFKTAEGVCGDYYDILPSRKDRISFVLADVAGKGMNSLIIMVMIRAILRLVVNTKQTAATIISWANRGVCAESSIDHFASLALINYDSINKKIQFATAGTTPVLLYEAETKKIKKLSNPSEPIGVEKTTEYLDNEFTLKKDDIVITYTDGLVETVDSTGKQYTSQRLKDVITKNSSLSGKEIANLVKTDVNKFCGSTHQHDDQTLLVIKIQ